MKVIMSRDVGDEGKYVLWHGNSTLYLSSAGRWQLRYCGHSLLGAFEPVKLSELGFPGIPSGTTCTGELTLTLNADTQTDKKGP